MFQAKLFVLFLPKITWSGFYIGIWDIVCVTAKTEAQCWPIEKYTKVISALYEDHNLYPVFVGSRKDKDLHKKLILQLGFGNSTAGLSVLETAAIIKKGRFYIGNDTGAMHLAASVGTRCVSIMSSRNIQGTWTPLGDGHKVYQFKVDCGGCGLDKCRLEEQYCLTNISELDVLASCRNLITELRE